MVSSAASATLRKRVSGVRRSCATLSMAPRMPLTSDWMRSSISLTRAPSSSSGSCEFLIGTRASNWPVCRIDRTVRLERTQRRQRGTRQQEPAGHRGDGDQRQDLEAARAEAPQQLVADVRAAPHLHHHAVRQHHRADFQHGAIGQAAERGPARRAHRRRVERRQVELTPPRRRGEIHRLGPLVHDADQQPLVPALSGVRLDHSLQPGEARALVLDGIARQHRLQHVVVLRGQGARQQHVGGAPTAPRR